MVTQFLISQFKLKHLTLFLTFFGSLKNILLFIICVASANLIQAHKTSIELNRLKAELNQNEYEAIKESKQQIYKVFDLHDRLLEICTQLDFIPIYLRRFPLKKYYNQNGIDQLSHLKYHLEVYVHKLHTVLEIMRLLVNEIFSYNLHPKECSWKKLIQQSGFRTTDTFSILDSYHKIFEDFIKTRHLNTHRGIFKDSDYSKLKSALLYYNLPEEYGFSKKELNEFYPKYLLDSNIKLYRQKRLTLVLDSNKIAFDYVKRFFDSLSKTYIAKWK